MRALFYLENLLPEELDLALGVVDLLLHDFSALENLVRSLSQRLVLHLDDQTAAYLESCEALSSL